MWYLHDSVHSLHLSTYRMLSCMVMSLNTIISHDYCGRLWVVRWWLSRQQILYERKLLWMVLSWSTSLIFNIWVILCLIIWTTLCLSSCISLAMCAGPSGKLWSQYVKNTIKPLQSDGPSRTYSESENWTLTKGQCSRTQAAEMKWIEWHTDRIHVKRHTFE